MPGDPQLCNQLAGQRSGAAGQVVMLNSQIENIQQNIDIKWAAALAADIFGAPYPSQSFNDTVDLNAISNRCVTITQRATQSQLGQAQTAIQAYQAIMGLINQKLPLMAQLGPAQVTLTNIVLQQLNAGCLN